MISDYQIEKLREIYQEEFGIELTKSEALEVGIKIVIGVRRVADLAAVHENENLF